MNRGRVRRSSDLYWLAAVAVGLATWFPLVPDDNPKNLGAQPRVALFWLAGLAGAAILGVVFPRQARQIAWGMAGSWAVAALYNAPRGDGDGLWTMWFLVIAAIGGCFSLVARAAGWLRTRSERHSTHG